jgi:hypothetical protein
LGELQPILRQISDLRRFTAMASADKLEFSSLPLNFLYWASWFEDNILNPSQYACKAAGMLRAWRV